MKKEDDDVNRRLLLAVAAALALMVSASGMAAETTLRMMTYGGPEQIYYLDLIKAGFEAANPGYKLEYEIAAFGEYIDKVLVNYAAGTSPDVFLTWAQYKSQGAEEGIILDVTDRIARSQVIRLENFYPVIEQNLSYNGRLWGTPWGFNGKLYIANVDLLNERGLAVPDLAWTVGDFADYARKITRPEEQVFAITTPPIRAAGGETIQWFKNWAGHAWVSEDGRTVLVDSNEAVELVEFWRDLVLDFHIAPSGEYTRRPGASFLVTGDVAFEEQWSTITSQMARLIEQEGRLPVNWEFVTYPAAPRGQKHFAQGHLWTIPANHPDPDKAWTLLEWLGSKEADMIWSASQRTPPTMPDPDHWAAFVGGLPAEHRDKALRFIIDVLYIGEYAENFEYWPTYGEMSEIMGQQMVAVFSGQVPPQAAMSEARRLMQNVLDEYWASRE